MYIFTEKFINRFWSNVDRKSEEECWNWKKFKNNHGYGRVGYTYEEYDITLGTHRVAYELEYGPFEEKLFVCHKCDNPSCCNPKHLFLGTAADNVHDMDDKNRRNNVKGEDVNTAVLTETQVTEIRNRYFNEKISYGKLAKEYGVHKSTVAYLIKGKNWKYLENTQKKYEDYRFACSNLTKDIIVEIRNIYAEGNISQRELSIKYNIGLESIRELVRGERWKDVGGPIIIREKGISSKNKISYEIAETIRKEYSDQLEGVTMAYLSDKYGVSAGFISRIINNKAWKTQ